MARAGILPREVIDSLEIANIGYERMNEAMRENEEISKDIMRTRKKLIEDEAALIAHRVERRIAEFRRMRGRFGMFRPSYYEELTEHLKGVNDEVEELKVNWDRVASTGQFLTGVVDDARAAFDDYLQTKRELANATQRLLELEGDEQLGTEGELQQKIEERNQLEKELTKLLWDRVDAESALVNAMFSAAEAQFDLSELQESARGWQKRMLREIDRIREEEGIQAAVQWVIDIRQKAPRWARGASPEELYEFGKEYIQLLERASTTATDVERRESEILDLNAQIAEKKESIEEVSQRIAEIPAEIAEARAEVERLTNELLSKKEALRDTIVGPFEEALALWEQLTDIEKWAVTADFGDVATQLDTLIAQVKEEGISIPVTVTGFELPEITIGEEVFAPAAVGAGAVPAVHTTHDVNVTVDVYVRGGLLAGIEDTIKENVVDAIKEGIRQIF